MKKQTRNPATILIILCVVVYAASCIGRKAYDSNINEIMAFYGQEKSTVGLVGTFFFISYAVGQVIHGLLCKYYNPKIIIGVALFVTSLVNFAIGFMPVSAFKYIKYIWFINGFAHAMFWSNIVLTMSKVVAKAHKSKTVVAFLIPVPLGNFLSYGLSALMSYLNNFRYTFFVSAILLFVVGIIWAVSVNTLFSKCLEQKQQLDEKDLEENQPLKDNTKTKNAIPKTFFVMFGVLALVAIIDNLVKDGINTWTPTLLKEKYNLENWFSVLLTLFIPMFAMFGSFLAIRIYKKTKNFLTVCGILFASSSIAFGVLLLCINLNTWIITLICFILVVLLMSGINYVLTFFFPVESGENVNAGMVAGLIDGFCYVGSAIASFGLGKIVEVFGSWDVVMYFLLSLTVLACVVCFVFTFIQKTQKT